MRDRSRSLDPERIRQIVQHIDSSLAVLEKAGHQSGTAYAQIAAMLRDARRRLRERLERLEAEGSPGE